MFKASLNGEGEVFLGSLKYMVEGMVIVSADAVRQKPIYIAQRMGPVIAAGHVATASRSMLFSGCAQARQTTRSLILKFCTKEWELTAKEGIQLKNVTVGVTRAVSLLNMMTSIGWQCSVERFDS